MSNQFTILHLEDQPLEAELIREAVLAEHLVCEFHVAPDAATFQQLLQAVSPDLVLSDYKVPGFSGHEALELVRAKASHIPFIFVSGSMGEERAIETLRGGATDYVLKDRLERLVPAIRRALEEARNRREAEAATRALRESEQRLELALRGADLGLWDWDVPSGKVVFNNRWATMLGHAPDEIEPRLESWKSRIHPDDEPAVTAALDKHLEGDSVFFEAEHRLRARNGDWRWVLNRGRVVLRDEHGQPLRVTGTHLDITERKLAELTNLQLEAQLQQAQKMESLGTLAGGIAHDFNNILGAIIGFSELVRNDLPPVSSSRSDMDEVLKAANRAKHLVEQILTFSRQQPHDLKPIHLPDVVHEALHFLRATIPSTIEVSLHLERGTPMILGDATQVYQIIINLATNSVHALPEGGGKIEISAGPANIVDGEIPGAAELQPGLHAVLSVFDNGHGMDSAVQSRIFDPFFTTKGPGTGTGLGLAVVHGIVKKHSGAIRVNSAPGEGTRFDIYFPAAPGNAAGAGHGTDGDQSEKGGRVMLVDDEPALVRVGKLMLERLGFEVEVFTDSEAAWQAFAEAPRRFQLVVTDQTMPRITGLELSNRILKMCPNLPVILTTGYHADASRKRVREAGVAELLMKPYTIESLGNLVKVALARSVSDSAPTEDR